MRIRYLSQYYPPEPGAPAARVSQFSRHWVRLGHSVEVVTEFPNHPTGVVPAEWQGMLLAEENDQGVLVQRNWAVAMPNRRMWQRLVGQASYGLSASTLGWARARPADVIIATHPSIFTWWAGVIHARSAHIPFVFEVRDLWPQLFIELGIIRNRIAVRALQRLETAMYRSADLVVTVTHRFARAIAQRGIAEDRIRVMSNGADLDLRPQPGERERIREEWGVQGRFVVAYTGTLGILQGLENLLAVAERLRGDPRFAFLFVGEGAGRAALEELVRAKALKNVSFLGAQPYAKMGGIYAAADVCYVSLRAHPFLLENFVPSKIFEILAVGTPIIAALGGEAAEIVQASGLGVVVPPEDVEACRVAILKEAASPARRPARDAARRFAQQYDRRVIAERYAEALQELLQRQAPQRLRRAA